MIRALGIFSGNKSFNQSTLLFAVHVFSRWPLSPCIATMLPRHYSQISFLDSVFTYSITGSHPSFRILRPIGDTSGETVASSKRFALPTLRFRGLLKISRNRLECMLELCLTNLTRSIRPVFYIGHCRSAVPGLRGDSKSR